MHDDHHRIGLGVRLGLGHVSGTARGVYESELRARELELLRRSIASYVGLESGSDADAADAVDVGLLIQRYSTGTPYAYVYCSVS